MQLLVAKCTFAKSTGTSRTRIELLVVPRGLAVVTICCWLLESLGTFRSLSGEHWNYVLLYYWIFLVVLASLHWASKSLDQTSADRSPVTTERGKVLLHFSSWTVQWILQCLFSGDYYDAGYFCWTFPIIRCLALLHTRLFRWLWAVLNFLCFSCIFVQASSIWCFGLLTCLLWSSQQLLDLPWGVDHRIFTLPLSKPSFHPID
jgi:hypothetical protein